MNLAFFSFVFWVLGQGQTSHPAPGVQADESRAGPQLVEVERQIEAMRAAGVASGVIVEPNGRVSLNLVPNERLMTLASLVTELELDAMTKASLWQQLQALTPGEIPVTPEMKAMLAEDAKIAGYQRDQRAIEESLRLAREAQGLAHEAVKALEARLQVAKQRVDEETAVKTNVFHKQLLDRVQSSHMRAQSMLDAAQAQLNAVRAEQRQRDQSLAGYLRLLETRDRLRADLSGNQAIQALPAPHEATLVELKQAVEQTRALLEQAQTAHRDAVRQLNAATEEAGRSAESDADVEADHQVESRPARESGN